MISLRRGGSTPVAEPIRPCTICGSPARLVDRSSQADLFRCSSCAHCFADQQSIREHVEYDEAYGDLDHKNWFENPNVRLFDWIDRRLGDEPTTSVLDVGCGRASFLSFLRGRHPRWHLTGIEVLGFDPPPGIELVVGDFESTHLGRRFDAVVSLAVIEHVADPHKFVRHLLEAVRPGGTIVLMTLNEQSVLYDASRVLHRAHLDGPFEQLYSTHHLNHFTKSSFARLLELHGLLIDDRHDGHIPLAAIDFPPRGAVADAIQRAGAAGTFALGRLTRRCYLQTVVCRAP
jgi:2-polyprenyl-3-methyl-5-hydroxy-6-metoxy-1,4-benzoquinol methylase